MLALLLLLIGFPQHLVTQPQSGRLYVSNTDRRFPGSIYLADFKSDCSLMIVKVIGVQVEKYGPLLQQDVRKTHAKVLAPSGVEATEVTLVEIGGSAPMYEPLEVNKTYLVIAPPPKDGHLTIWQNIDERNLNIELPIASTSPQERYLNMAWVTRQLTLPKGLDGGALILESVLEALESAVGEESIPLAIFLLNAHLPTDYPADRPGLKQQLRGYVRRLEAIEHHDESDLVKCAVTSALLALWQVNGADSKFYNSIAKLADTAEENTSLPYPATMVPIRLPDGHPLISSSGRQEPLESDHIIRSAISTASYPIQEYLLPFVGHIPLARDDRTTLAKRLKSSIHRFGFKGNSHAVAVVRTLERDAFGNSPDTAPGRPGRNRQSGAIDLESALAYWTGRYLVAR